MNAVEIVKTFITALQSGEIEMAATIMADDFVAHGLADHELDKRVFLAMQSELQDAMPDLSYNLSEVHTHEHLVQALIMITGTQSHDLTLPMFNAQVSATGLAISLPQVPVEYVLAGQQIKEMRVQAAYQRGGHHPRVLHIDYAGEYGTRVLLICQYIIYHNYLMLGVKRVYIIWTQGN